MAQEKPPLLRKRGGPFQCDVVTRREDSVAAALAATLAAALALLINEEADVVVAAESRRIEHALHDERGELLVELEDDHSGERRIRRVRRLPGLLHELELGLE